MSSLKLFGKIMKKGTTDLVSIIGEGEKGFAERLAKEAEKRSKTGFAERLTEEAEKASEKGSDRLR